jgi:signal transduction histidine kinase
MKTILKILPLFLFLVFFEVNGQATNDSITNLLSNVKHDTSKVMMLEQISKSFWNSDLENALKYAQEGLKLANEINFDKGKSRCLNRIGGIYGRMGQHQKGLQTLFEASRLAKEINDIEGYTRAKINMGVIYGEQLDNNKAIDCYKEATRYSQKIKNKELYLLSLMNIGAEYVPLGQYDSAQYYTKKSYDLAIEQKSREIDILLYNLGNINFKKKNYDKALTFFKASSKHSKDFENNRFLSLSYYMIAKTFNIKSQLDSSLFYAQLSNKLALKSNNPEIVYESYRLLFELFENSNPKLALDYLKKSSIAKDSLYNINKNLEIQKLTFNEKILEKELEFSKIELKNKQILALILSALAIFIIVSINLYILNKNKTKLNRILTSQKTQIEQQKIELQNSLEKLRVTQKQLMLQEKLASLGELTAGIAHEIQNPLNFVNNFGELSQEMVIELDELIEKNDEKDKSEIKEILNDLKTNIGKITSHGNRASSIVKNMLEHSRGNKSEMTLVNINKLADEYLRLSYHGMRAKDQNFNSDYDIKIDESLKPIKAYGGDISRAILNILNNAFYAVNEKNRSKTDDDYKPKVVIKTNRTTISNKEFAEIIIEDNGSGIPDEIKQKIFQPFFSTKPSGQGTGLGLSLSREIVETGHNGTLEVESEKGMGTKFIIRLPIT